MEFGADGYITKPFSIELLLAHRQPPDSAAQTLPRNSSQSARNKVWSSSVAMSSPTVTRVYEGGDGVAGRNVENSELTIDQLASHWLGRTTMYNKLKSLPENRPSS